MNRWGLAGRQGKARKMKGRGDKRKGKVFHKWECSWRVKSSFIRTGANGSVGGRGEEREGTTFKLAACVVSLHILHWCASQCRTTADEIASKRGISREWQRSKWERLRSGTRIEGGPEGERQGVSDRGANGGDFMVYICRTTADERGGE